MSIIEHFTKYRLFTMYFLACRVYWGFSFFEKAFDRDFEFN